MYPTRLAHDYIVDFYNIVHVVFDNPSKGALQLLVYRFLRPFLRCQIKVLKLTGRHP